LDRERARRSAFPAILANLLATLVLTPITRRLDPREARDETAAEDYVEVGEPARAI
jgi:hypothetical protein